jgi:hypothetical protein
VGCSGAYDALGINPVIHRGWAEEEAGAAESFKRASQATPRTMRMAMSITVARKKLGRPVTGESPIRTIRVSPDLDRRIAEWAKANGKKTHSDATRHLLELGLSNPKGLGKR